DVAQVVDLDRLHRAADRAARVELHALHEAEALVQQRRYDANLQHPRQRSRKLRSRRRPWCWLFSGWNCTAQTFRFATADVKPPQYGVAASVSAGSWHSTWNEWTK